MTFVPANDPNWTIALVFATTGETVYLALESELLVGRPAPGKTQFDGLDVTPFNGVDMGVSRNHALLRWEDNQLVMTDLGSGNGTFLNGMRLPENIAYRVSDGDKIHFGQLEVLLRINHDVGKSSIVAMRPGIEILSVPIRAREQTILIVEDDIAITRLYQVVLDKAGYKTRICQDVVTAIRLFNQEAPALILLDLKLVGVHGLELCRYIRRDTLHPNLPIVVASALYDQQTIQQAMEAGADLFVSKPINYKELVRVVASLIQTAESGSLELKTKQLAKPGITQRLGQDQQNNDTLVVYVNGRREPLSILVRSAVTLGRHNPADTSGNHINLDGLGAFDKGVSRVHARIERTPDGFLLDDNQSTNGTFINGKPVLPGQPQLLKNGDEVYFGSMRMRMYVLAEGSTPPPPPPD